MLSSTVEAIEKKCKNMNVKLLTDDQIVKFMTEFPNQSGNSNLEIWKSVFLEIVNRYAKFLETANVDNLDTMMGANCAFPLFKLLDSELVILCKERVFDNITKDHQELIMSQDNNLSKICTNEKYVAVCVESGVILIEAKTGQMVKRFHYPGSKVLADFSPNNQQLALLIFKQDVLDLEIVELTNFTIIISHNLRENSYVKDSTLQSLTYITANVFQVITDQGIRTIVLNDQGFTKSYLKSKVEVLAPCLEVDVDDGLSYEIKDNKLILSIFRDDFALINKVLNSIRKDYYKISESKLFRDMPQVARDSIDRKISGILADLYHNRDIFGL